MGISISTRLNNYKNFSIAANVEIQKPSSLQLLADRNYGSIGESQSVDEQSNKAKEAKRKKTEPKEEEKKPKKATRSEIEPSQEETQSNIFALLPNEILYKKIYSRLDISSAYHLTSATKLFLPLRNEALHEYRNNNVSEHLAKLCKNLSVLNKEEARNKVGAYLRSLEKTYKSPTGKMYAEVHFDEKTIPVAIKLVMHNDEHEFYRHYIVEGIARIPGNPNNLTIDYDYRRICWGFLSEYGIVINYKNRGRDFDPHNNTTHSKSTEIPRSLFDGITDEDLKHDISYTLGELDKKYKIQTHRTPPWVDACCNCMIS
jgi:hypothetical protein